MSTNLKRLLLMCGVTAAGIVASKFLVGDSIQRTEREDQIAMLIGVLVVSVCVGICVFVKGKTSRQ